MVIDSDLAHSYPASFKVLHLDSKLKVSVFPAGFIMDGRLNRQERALDLQVNWGRRMGG